MMDVNHTLDGTTLNPLKSTQELPRELLAAISKHDARQAKVISREGFGATTKGMALTQHCMGTLGAAFSVALLEAPRADADEAKMLRIVGKLDPDVIALCVIHNALSTMARKGPQLVHALLIGEGLAGECWAAGFLQSDEKRAKAVARRVKLRHASSSVRLMAAKREAAQSYTKRDGTEVHSYEVRNWGNALKVRAGIWALNVLTSALPDIFSWREEITGTAHGAETTRFLRLSSAAWDVIEAVLTTQLENKPVFFPELTPPKPWTAWTGGGSHDPRVNSNCKFLRSRHKSTGAAVRAAIKSGQMQPALDAVNALQATAWRLNDVMFDVIVECFNRGMAVKGLPKVNQERPVRLKDAEWSAMTAQERKLKKVRDEQLVKAINTAMCDKVMFTTDMAQARDLAVVERFYTPMNCDWRGRVYALSHFNFQRDDRIRSMFLFADGEPIGEDGLRWLKVHVANCGDFGKISKRPIAERIKWCDDNISWLKTNASEPLKYVNWTNADKPFLFLAAVKELVAALTEGPSFVSHLPVSFDGSCSGLQHLSAMTRASEGSLVNLTPSRLPQDVYQTVADLVNARLQEALDTQPENLFDDKLIAEAKRTRELAQLALSYGIGRNEVKRGVMTYAYSSKKFGMACQLQSDLIKPLEEEVLEGKHAVHPFAPYDQGSSERPSGAARFLAEHIFESIESVVHKPAEAMKYLQKLAKALAHERKVLRWTTPVGIPWINRYHDPVTKRVELWLNDNGVRIRNRLTVAVDDKPEINKEQAANGVAPNFVHALDASHLLLVASAARDRGITSIATVHDSFGCLPSRATAFNQIIREQFALMYETHDVLAEILATAKCDLTDNDSDRLPTAIEPGPLNIRDIINADFAFA